MKTWTADEVLAAAASVRAAWCKADALVRAPRCEKAAEMLTAFAERIKAGESAVPEEWIGRHQIAAGECPPQSLVLLASSVRRTFADPPIQPSTSQADISVVEGVAAWLLHRFGPDTPEGEHARLLLDQSSQAEVRAHRHFKLCPRCDSRLGFGHFIPLAETLSPEPAKPELQDGDEVAVGAEELRVLRADAKAAVGLLELLKKERKRLGDVHAQLYCLRTLIDQSHSTGALLEYTDKLIELSRSQWVDPAEPEQAEVDFVDDDTSCAQGSPEWQDGFNRGFALGKKSLRANKAKDAT